MTDRELLEWAAKSIGLRDEWSEYCGVMELPERPGGRLDWNPLIYDGDALRLAVNLNLLDEHPGFTYELAVQMGATNDPYVATRRAIVRTAAEIGKGMA